MIGKFAEETVYDNLLTDEIQERTERLDKPCSKSINAKICTGKLHFWTAQFDDAWYRTKSVMSFISETEYLAGITFPFGLMKEP